MVKEREMRGQPGKKVGCPDRQWMLEGIPWAIVSGKKLFLYFDQIHAKLTLWTYLIIP